MGDEQSCCACLHIEYKPADVWMDVAATKDAPAWSGLGKRERWLCLACGGEFTRTSYDLQRENERLKAERASSLDRDFLGSVVRKAWTEWAKEQDHAKSSWLLSWEELPESDKEADRCIGEAVANVCVTPELLLVEQQYERLREALHDIAGGHTSQYVDAPDVMTAESPAAFRADMWSWSQRIARTALAQPEAKEREMTEPYDSCPTCKTRHPKGWACPKELDDLRTQLNEMTQRANDVSNELAECCESMTVGETALLVRLRKREAENERLLEAAELVVLDGLARGGDLVENSHLRDLSALLAQPEEKQPG